MEFEHDVDGAFVGEFDLIALLFGEFLYEGLEGFILGAGEEAERFVVGAGGEEEGGDYEEAERAEEAFVISDQRIAFV